MAKARRKLKSLVNLPKARLFHGDCLKVVPCLGSFDCIFADPPFNNDSPYDAWNDSLTKNEYIQFTTAWMRLCAEALNEGGSFWINVPDQICPLILNIAGQKCGLQVFQWCIWHYRFGQYTPSRFTPSKVHALWFVRKKETPKWNPEAVKVPSLRQKRNDPRAKEGGRPPLDVWGFEQFWGRVQGNNKERRPGHVNQLPEKYLERVLLACTDEGDRVLDPFLGSGTTGVVAKALGRRFVGIDISMKYVRSARNRIKEGAVRCG